MRKVFISYRHENNEHKSKVYEFAKSLEAKQVPVEFDQFYLEEFPEGPDEGWPKWSRDRAVNAECVLVIASPGWFEAYESTEPTGKGLGSAAEGRILSQIIYNSHGISTKTRFVILKTSGNCQFPVDLEGWHKFDLSTRPDDIDRIVAWVRRKLSISTSDRPPQRFVYLAECLIESDGLREGLAEELVTRGWNILPDAKAAPSYDKPIYAAHAAIDMRRSVAFVQLLQPDRWKGLDHDYIQHEQALSVGLPQIRYRSPDLDCTKILDEFHRQFLTSDPGVIARPFDQFKKELFERLDELWDRLHQAPTPGLSPIAKLIRIIDRSSDPEANWAKVFPWFDSEAGIIHDRIKLYDSKEKPLTIRQRTKPCQGFLIVCDAAAWTDPSLSPDGPLDECQQIQLGYVDNSQCPPVGVVYWPPPPEKDAWPRLLGYKPLKLHRVTGDNYATTIPDFFSAVRGVSV